MIDPLGEHPARSMGKVKQFLCRFGCVCARRCFLGLLCILVQACATPTGELKDLAAQSGFTSSKVAVGEFDLLAFSNASLAHKRESARSRFAKAEVLHVYLEGDGSPWRYRTMIMPDPTPRNPLMLRLMAMDPHAAVYLGRPCYNGSASEPGCDNSLWTSARYSTKVVNSMASGIRALAKRHRSDQIWLMGHSGGGALAMLLAAELPQVERVVTIAGNLDTDAWTRFHGYTPLFSSINPARMPALRPEILQWHLIGGKDQVIPAQLIKPVIMDQPSARGFEFRHFRHGCCWEQIWPDVLQALELDQPARVPAFQFKRPAAPLAPSDNL